MALDTSDTMTRCLLSADVIKKNNWSYVLNTWRNSAVFLFGQYSSVTRLVQACWTQSHIHQSGPDFMLNCQYWSQSLCSTQNDAFKWGGKNRGVQTQNNNNNSHSTRLFLGVLGYCSLLRATRSTRLVMCWSRVATENRKGPTWHSTGSVAQFSKPGFLFY